LPTQCRWIYLTDGQIFNIEKISIEPEASVALRYASCRLQVCRLGLSRFWTAGSKATSTLRPRLMPYEQECASGLHWQLAQLPSSPEFARSWAATSRSGIAGSECFYFEANELTCISGVRWQLVSLHVRRGDNVPSQVLPLSPDSHGAIPRTRPLSNVSILCSEHPIRRVSPCGPFAGIPQAGSPAEQTHHEIT
jgi:hypothetical protein